MGCIAIIGSITPYLIHDPKLSAPIGHLPSHFWASGTQLGKHMKALAAKVASCYN